jgi:hypothetical protein
LDFLNVTQDATTIVVLRSQKQFADNPFTKRCALSDGYQKSTFSEPDMLKQYTVAIADLYHS